MNEAIVTIPAEDGNLEGRISMPAGARCGVVLCHPHPQFGGNQDNNVVLGVRDALVSVGIATLRFNFRGVGGSEGSYGGGIGEAADARAAIGTLRQQTALDRIGLMGYSFGAAVAGQVASSTALVDRLALVAVPLSMWDGAALREFSGAICFVHGDADDFTPVSSVRDLADSIPQRARIDVVPGANHFFFGVEARVGASIADFFLEGETGA